MHKTAYNIGGLALKIYASCEKARVLEIGAMNVNGSLRDHMRPDMDYIGIDMEEGPGVDFCRSTWQSCSV